MENSRKTVGFLMTSSPEHQNSYTAFRLAEALLVQGHSVELFFMDDGIYNVVRNSAEERLFTGVQFLIEKGANALICALSAESRGYSSGDLIPQVGLMSQYELSEIASRSDRFLYFGP